MAEDKDLAALQVHLTSLAKTLSALFERNALSHAEIAELKKTKGAEATWNPIKQNDLVPVTEIIGHEDEFDQEETKKARRIVFKKPLSVTDKVLFDQVNQKIELLARDILAKAKDGFSAERLKIDVSSPWGRMTKGLLDDAIKMLEKS